MKEGTITTKFFLLICLICLAFTTMSFGQNPVYSTIAKNVNPDAKSLRHDLNASGDTLILKSDYMLYKVEFIGNYDLKVFEVKGSKKETKIDLSSVPVGEYTIAAFQIERSDDIYQYQKTIIFRVSRLLPIDRLKEDFEEVIVDNDEVEEETQIASTINESEDLSSEELNDVADKEAKPAILRKKRTPKPRPEKKTRVASNTEKTKTIRPKKERVVREKKIVERVKPVKKERFVTRKSRDTETEYKSYNLTNGRGGRYAVQSRAEYRENNVRPNGEPYN